MTMSLSSLRVPEELAAFFEGVAKSHPEKFPTKADAMRAALEFYRDFHLNSEAIERNIMENFELSDPAVKRMVLDVPKDQYNMLRELRSMGRGASVAELIRNFLKKFIKGELKGVLREKEDLLRAQEAIRAHDNSLRLRDNSLTR